MTIHEYWLLFLNIIFLLPETSCSHTSLKDFPGGSTVKNLPAMQETPVQSLGWEDHLQKGKATHSSILT